MQLLPTPPTDNLYKFMAISGLWLVAGILLFMFWLVYWGFQSQIEMKHSQEYFFSVNMEREISSRINSINSGKYDENKLSWVPAGSTPEQERSFLKFGLDNHRKTIEKYKKEVEAERIDIIEYIGEKYLIVCLSLYASVMSFFLVFGFSWWYKKVQKPSEKMHDIDYKIKQLTQDKLELEISLLRKGKGWVPFGSQKG